METVENIDFIANVCLDNVADDDLPQKVEGPVILIDQDPTLLAPIKGKRGNQIISHFMTWNNYPLDGVEILERYFQPLVKNYCFQPEISKSGTPHLQGVFNLKKAMRWSEFDLPKSIHWEPTRNVIGSDKYCSKDDTRDGPDTHRWPRAVKKPLAPPKATLRVIKELRPWQQSIVDIVTPEPDERTVHWVYDEEGCMGKTVFSKYLFKTQNAIIATGGAARDIACLLAGLTKSTPTKPGRNLDEQTTFIFNFPRSTEGISWKAIEMVKDGLITSSKYESCTLAFNCPHVICFSNELPDKSKLSDDRWKIWTIKDMELIPYIDKIDTSFNDELLDLQGVDKLMFV